MARHLADLRGEPHPPVLALSDQLTQLGYLRNELTHSLRGIQQHDLANRFGMGTGRTAEAAAIVPHLEQMYAVATGQPIALSPYATINALVADLLHERRSGDSGS